MTLTDMKIRKTKPKSKPVRLGAGGGLYVLVQPNDKRWWRWDYRRPVTGQRNTLSLGTYPEIMLAQARELRDAARKLVAAGIDPGVQRKAKLAAGKERAANSFEVVAREWLDKQSWVDGYKSKVIGWMQNDVFPWIGGRPVSDLQAADFLAVGQRIYDRGVTESTHRILRNCGQVMRYAVATRRADRNPVPDLQGAFPAAQGQHHAAITDPIAFGGLLRAIDGYTGTAVTRAALRLAPLVFVRPGELRQAEWSEIDLDKAEWRIAAEKMKLREPHIVPLSAQAIEILRELQPVTERGRYVFPGARSRERPMSNNAINAALRVLGYDKDTMTGHGFRATARTLLDEELGFRYDLIEHQLAHAVRDPTGRAYNRTTHLPERRKMMQTWADYLDQLRSGANVIPLWTKQRSGKAAQA